MLCCRIIETSTDKLDASVSGEMSSEEINRFNDQTLQLRLMILAWLLVKHASFGKKEYSSEEIGFMLSIAVSLCLQDNGLSKDLAEKRLIAFHEEMKEYNEAVVKRMEHSDYKTQETDVFFHLLTYFRDKVLHDSKIDLKIEPDSNKHYLVFFLANQIYKQDAEAFRASLREVKFLS